MSESNAEREARIRRLIAALVATGMDPQRAKMAAESGQQQAQHKRKEV